ncbi:MAG: hypothetical protein ACP5D4_21055 [Baaleninema sp.]
MSGRFVAVVVVRSLFLWFRFRVVGVVGVRPWSWRSLVGLAAPVRPLSRWLGSVSRWRRVVRFLGGASSVVVVLAWLGGSSPSFFLWI